MRLASVSVDLDSLGHYCRIQGLPLSLLDERARNLVATVAIPRFLELFTAAKTSATFFVIAADLDEPLARALRDAHANRVELANHSHTHDYAISRWSADDALADLTRAHALIREHTAVAPVGFRAPGYTLSPALLAAVQTLGYRYDSSAYPAAPYYLAKASVMAALSLLGRPSKAILDSPKVLLAPRVPYRPSVAAPYRAGDASFVELPMSVSPALRMPFIGTFATTLPWALVQSTLRSLATDDFINFELHAIDVLDVDDGIPPALARQQRDLLVPWAEKKRRLLHLFNALGESRERVTVAEAADHFSTRV